MEYVRGVLDTVEWNLGMLEDDSVTTVKKRLRKFRKQLVALLIEDFEFRTMSSIR